MFVAEREGFEPSERYKRSLPFQGSAIDHSAISPDLALYLIYYYEFLTGTIAIPPLLSKNPSVCLTLMPELFNSLCISSIHDS